MFSILHHGIAMAATAKLTVLAPVVAGWLASRSVVIERMSFS